MCDNKQCMAPVKGKRCENLIIGDKLHCEIHFKTAITLYNQYKQTYKELELYSLDKVSIFKSIQEKIKYLHKYYCLCITAYKGRMKHRDYSFIPELFDYGHELQFDILLNKIKEIEDKLSDLYTEFIQEKEDKNKDKEKEFEPEQNDEEIEITMNKIKKFKKKRVNDVILTNRIIDKYIRENKKIKDDTNSIIEKLISLMTEFCSNLTEQTIYEKLFGLYHLLSRLHVLGYFLPDFKYEKTMGHKIDITCHCIKNYTNMKDFFFESQPTSLKMIYQIIDQNRKRINNICSDYNDLWDNLGSNVLNTKVVVVWNPAFNRLSLKSEEEFQSTISQVRNKKYLVSDVDTKYNCGRLEMVTPNPTKYGKITNSIIKKWREQKIFIQFIDGNKLNCHVKNLRVVDIKDAMDHVHDWVVDWDAFLTDQERKMVLSPQWREGLTFRDKK